MTCQAQYTWVFLRLEPPCLCWPSAKPFPVNASTVRRKPLLGTKLTSAYAAQGGQLHSEVGGCCEQLWPLTSCCEQITLSFLGDYIPCSPVFLSSTCVPLILSNDGRIHFLESRSGHALYPCPTHRHRHTLTHTQTHTHIMEWLEFKLCSLSCKHSPSWPGSNSSSPILSLSPASQAGSFWGAVATRTALSHSVLIHAFQRKDLSPHLCLKNTSLCLNQLKISSI